MLNGRWLLSNQCKYRKMVPDNSVLELWNLFLYLHWLDNNHWCWDLRSEMLMSCLLCGLSSSLSSLLFFSLVLFIRSLHSFSSLLLFSSLRIMGSSTPRWKAEDLSFPPMRRLPRKKSGQRLIFGFFCERTSFSPCCLPWFRVCLMTVLRAVPRCMIEAQRMKMNRPSIRDSRVRVWERFISGRSRLCTAKKEGGKFRNTGLGGMMGR